MTPAAIRTHCRIETSGCWVWQGSSAGKWGFYDEAGTRHWAHRELWQVENGPLAKGKRLFNLCGHHCANPAHWSLSRRALNVKVVRQLATTKRVAASLASRQPEPKATPAESRLRTLYRQMRLLRTHRKRQTQPIEVVHIRNLPAAPEPLQHTPATVHKDLFPQHRDRLLKVEALIEKAGAMMHEWHAQRDLILRKLTSSPPR